jgi:vitamin B12 transporter
LQRDRLNHDALNAGITWKALVGAGNNSTLTASLGFTQDYFNTYGPTQVKFYRQGTLDSKAFTARVEHDWQVTPNFKLQYGFDLKNSAFAGEAVSTSPILAARNETEERDRFNTALFLLNTWQITPSFQVEAGLRQNFNSEYDSSLNPSAGLRWDITPAIALRGSWASVQRNPGLDQLYLFDTVHNWLPNPDLEPETGSSWTAGLDFKFAPGLTGQLTYFGSRLEDRLGIQFGKWQNIGLVETSGLEVALRWQISPRWSTFINYTYTDAEIKTGSEKGLQLSMVPFSVGQLGIGYESNGWRVNLYGNYYSGARRAFFLDAGTSSTDFTPAWFSLGLSARIPLFQNVGLLVYLENLTDVRYEKANRIYEPGFTLQIGLTASI